VALVLYKFPVVVLLVRIVQAVGVNNKVVIVLIGNVDQEIVPAIRPLHGLVLQVVDGALCNEQDPAGQGVGAGFMVHQCSTVLPAMEGIHTIGALGALGVLALFVEDLFLAVAHALVAVAHIALDLAPNTRVVLLKGPLLIGVVGCMPVVLLNFVVLGLQLITATVMEAVEAALDQRICTMVVPKLEVIVNGLIGGCIHLAMPPHVELDTPPILVAAMVIVGAVLARMSDMTLARIQVQSIVRVFVMALLQLAAMVYVAVEELTTVLEHVEALHNEIAQAPATVVPGGTAPISVMAPQKSIVVAFVEATPYAIANLRRHPFRTALSLVA